MNEEQNNEEIEALLARLNEMLADAPDSVPMDE